MIDINERMDWVEGSWREVSSTECVTSNNYNPSGCSSVGERATRCDSSQIGTSYKFEESTSSSSSCVVGSAFSCNNSSNVGKSYVSSCDGPTYTCSSDSILNGTKCYAKE